MLEVSDQVAIVGVYAAVLTFLLGVLIPIRNDLRETHRRIAAATPADAPRAAPHPELVLVIDGAQVLSAFTLVLCLLWFAALIVGQPLFGGAGLRILTGLTLAIFSTVLVALAVRAWDSFTRLKDRPNGP